MDKLIITVAADSSVSWPGNPSMPKHDDVAALSKEYVDAVNAGASIAHIHGVKHLEAQPDGSHKVRFDFDGWRDMTERIRAGSSPILQYGIAAAPLAEKIRLMDYKPDMMSFAFAAQDMCFDTDPDKPAHQLYCPHPRSELIEAVDVARERGVKAEIECFQTGAFWNIQYVRDHTNLEDPLWATILLGYPGGTWSPPTQEALLYMVKHLPEGANWNLSVKKRPQWDLMPLVISLGGHVRVGWEDNPMLPNGQPAKTNAQLVENVVLMAEAMGREVATPDEARKIIGISS